jgi:hypothetical protein
MSVRFGPLRQLGYVVHDVESAMAGWLAQGVGPWFLVERVEMDWFRYRGADSPPPATSIALANSGDVQLELIQQHDDAPSMYKEFLDAGREGLQHVAYWSDDYQALYDDVLAGGDVIGHEGCIGGERGRFAYLDTEHHPGTVIEISDTSGSKGRFFGHIRKAAASWDGVTDPIRRV